MVTSCGCGSENARIMPNHQFRLARLSNSPHLLTQQPANEDRQKEVTPLHVNSIVRQILLSLCQHLRSQNSDPVIKVMATILAFPTFPPEIMDQVVDKLEFDIESLATCSLASRSLLSSSRYRLFHHVTLHGNRTASFLDLIKEPSNKISPFVESIQFDVCGKEELGMLYLMEMYLPHLDSLHLRNGSLVLNHESRAPEKLKSLYLQSCRTPSLHYLISFICALPSLERLTMSNVTWAVDDSIPQIVPHQRLNFIVLDLDTIPGGIFVEWLLTLDPAPTVNVLYIGLRHPQPHFIPAVCRFLQLAGSSIERLKFDFSFNAHSPFDQGECYLNNI